nr:Rieske (2Fe-2S) protein [Streptomyces sp. V1I6]
MDRLERHPRNDRVIDRVQRAVHGLPLGRGRDLLHGRWLGHPVHPLLVQVPIGSWFSAAVLDLLPGQRRGARALIGVGLAAVPPAAAAGWVDWADLQRQQMRVGLVHAAANITAVALYAGSFTARAEAVPHLVKSEWQEIGAVADFPVGRAVRRHVDDVPVLVVRESGNTVHVLADACSHMGGPLSEGTISDGCVRCPWHGSVFRLADGWNVRGPATAPQPAFDTRITDGRIEARLRRLESDAGPHRTDAA